MKKFNLFIYSFLVSLLAVFFIFSCHYGDETSLNESMPQLPLYDADYIGKKTGENHQNCCSCQTSGCSSSKCCSGGQNCSCTCSYHWWSGSQCNCSPCQTPERSSNEEFDIWLTEEQYSVWKEFSEILFVDGSKEAKNAMKALLVSYDAIAEDDYNTFIENKAKMGKWIKLLDLSTKNAVNKFLDKYKFEDERL